MADNYLGKVCIIEASSGINIVSKSYKLTLLIFQVLSHNRVAWTSLNFILRYLGMRLL